LNRSYSYSKESDSTKKKSKKDKKDKKDKMGKFQELNIEQNKMKEL